MSSKKFQQVFLIVQIATVAVFVGRAWQHIIWDAPFRTLLWDEAWMTSILPWFTSMPYEEFITSMSMDDAIQNTIKGFGWFYFGCAVIAIFIKKIPKLLTYVLWLGAVSLMLLAFLYCKEKFFQWGQFWEYSLQFSTPIFLFILWKKQDVTESLILIMKVAIAITFISHGLYALNYYPRPGNFTQMVIDILGVSEGTAIHFLNAAGVLDFIVAIGIFIKGKIGKLSLAYVIFWGLATTLARIWAHYYSDMMDDTLMMWVHESVYRMPHFLIPLAVLWWIGNGKKGRRIYDL